MEGYELRKVRTDFGGLGQCRAHRLNVCGAEFASQRDLQR